MQKSRRINLFLTVATAITHRRRGSISAADSSIPFRGPDRCHFTQPGSGIVPAIKKILFRTITANINNRRRPYGTAVSMNTRRRNRPCLAILLLPTASYAVAAPDINHLGRFKVNPLHLESGPSRDWVHIVQRDAAGYLWAGTDNGLRRYDGYQYTIFTSKADDPRSLGSSLIYTLLIDSEQRVWAGGRVLTNVWDCCWPLVTTSVSSRSFGSAR
mgnify:CR=1 FL=1